MKKIEKKMFCNLKNTYFLYSSFVAGPLALHFKGDLYSMRRHSYNNILNHSKWRTIEKDLPKCLVLGRRLMMGLIYLVLCKYDKVREIYLFCDLQIIDEN
jgi:hypothetical protein